MKSSFLTSCRCECSYDEVNKWLFYQPLNYFIPFLPFVGILVKCFMYRGKEDFVLFCNSTSLQLLYLIFHLIFPHLHVLFHFCCLSFLCNVMWSHNYCSSVECLSFLQKVEPFLEHMPCQKLISIFKFYFYENYNFCITRILIWLCFNLV